MTHRARRNVARTVGLALVACSLLLIWSGGDAGADGQAATLKSQGWWWEANNVPSATLPAPPTVKKGQLSVQSGPTGKAAFSAVRYELSPDAHGGSLTLKVGANGDTGGSSAVLLACRTGSAWSPADGGQWSAAPKVDTNACVNGERAADGASWTFAVGPLETGTVLDVAIVPGVDPATKQPGTFSLTFDAPDNGSLAAISGAAPPATATSPTFASTGSASGSISTGSVGTHSGITSRPSLPPTPTGLPSDKVGQTATAPANQAASQPGLSSTLVTTNASSSKPNKTAGYVVLVLAALAALYAYRQDNLMARNGGMLPGSADEEGGLGRFSKPRHGQPPALT